MKEAMFWKTAGSRGVLCELCPHACVLSNGEFGKCRVRKEEGGKLVTDNWGNVVSMATDPIEKKPLFHFWPGSQVFSIALPGCNLSCKFCQNWQISQERPRTGKKTDPKDIVKLALETKSQGIAYTYSEPTVFFEFAYETAKLAKKEGLYNCWISNGMITSPPIHKLSKVIDAVNIDLKAFRDEYYQEICGGVGLKPILNAIKTFHRNGVWVELTTLIVPGMNDDESEITSLVDWVADLDEDIPIHFSRFHPDYKMKYLEPTPESTLEKIAGLARSKLNHVYVGNVRNSNWENTYCANCGTLLIWRRSFSLAKNEIKEDGTCLKCGCKAPVIGNVIKV
ncbi:MAG: AmmeMemoRadiSam system radical SAM enzyme [Candidatus Altiarchaeota archaeon]|nr:AmmeMemoRadiSam system radical SAM enzyme [Candidatus Altiarchaeota archaeon]